ncbi:MAG TPA: hypothetical protein VH325_05675 [Bryobacteraceae bacterium]|nr:hypothetical protein [Bryobacteraceae bacterium]
MPGNTDQQRFDDTITYLGTIDNALAADVKQKLIGKTVEAGKDISLEGMGYWHSGNDAQHKAVRALLLCQKAYLTPPYFKGFFISFEKDKTKQFWHGKSETAVKDAIKCYLTKPGATYQTLVSAAKMVNQTSGDFDFYTLTRESRNLGANPICFSAVRMWLFKAGFVSIKWLASDGFDLTANSANQILGDGQIISLSKIDQIPPGHIFNFHAPESKPTCHWGLSIGNGLALAANTHQQILQSVRVNFITGNSFYGEFQLAESYDVCKWKYAREGDLLRLKVMGELPEITIRDIDPTLVPTYF